MSLPSDFQKLRASMEIYTDTLKIIEAFQAQDFFLAEKLTIEMLKKLQAYNGPSSSDTIN